MHESRGWAKATVLMGAVLVLVLDVAVLALRNRSHPVSLESAVDRYRREVAVTPIVGPTSTAPTTSEGGTRAEAEVPTTTRANGANRSSTVDGATAPSGQTQQAVAGWRRPAPGVYSFRTEGYARFRIARHDYPSSTHAIVHSGADCRWSMRHTLVEEDVDDFAFCTDAQSFQWFSWAISRSFFGVRQGWEYQCRDLVATQADIEAGRGFDVDCTTEGGDRAVGTGRFVGIDDLAIDDVTVKGYHYAVQIELEGSFRGTLATDLWLEGTSGLRVRERRVIDGAIPAGPYREEVSLDLVSLEPAT